MHIHLVVLVAALGYFVDVYDLILFSVVRVESLRSLGVQGDALLTDGVYLINMQQIGLLLGGIIWGVLGDKFGRVAVLFGSIILYSLANIANAFVHSVEWYAYLRFIAGIGLAGELGAGVTLVSELMPKEKRGYGTTIIATVGVLGAVVAGISSQYIDWRTNYLIGGMLGVLLLFLRFAVCESSMFSQVLKQDIKRGSLKMLFTPTKRLLRYIYCILSGVPIWFVIGVLVTFSPEIGAALLITEPILAGTAIAYTYLGLALGDLTCGLLSQYLKSRKKVLKIYIISSALMIALVLFIPGLSREQFYLLCLPLGCSVGYWAMFVQVAAEQFGTNLRSTVTTTVPNFVRGSAVLVTLLFTYLKEIDGVIFSASIVAVLTILVALFSVSRLDESFDRDLDFIEE